MRGAGAVTTLASNCNYVGRRTWRGGAWRGYQLIGDQLDFGRTRVSSSTVYLLPLLINQLIPWKLHALDSPSYPIS